MQKSVSVVIPAYREEKRIGKTLESMKNFLKANFKDYEVIVVVDKSEDRTEEVVRKHVGRNFKIVLNGKRMGKGHAVRQGMLVAKKDFVFFTDADSSAPAEEIWKFVENAGDFDVLIASRFHKHSKSERSMQRNLLTRFYNLIKRILLGLKFNDVQCGFKMFRRAAARRIFRKLSILYYSFDTEAVFIAKKLGMKIGEMPIKWKDMKGSTVKPGRDSIRMFRDVFRIFFRNLRGFYKK